MRSSNAKRQAGIEYVMKKDNQKITIPDLPKLKSSCNCNYEFKTAVDIASKLCYPYARISTKTEKRLDL